MKNYKIENKKENVELFIFFSNVNENIEKILFIEDIGYAGFKKKEELKDSLNYLGVDERNGEILEKNKELIKKIIRGAVKKCEPFFEDNRYIFIFPTSDKFVAEQMGGINGLTSWKKTILIFINPIKGWEENLKDIIIHEISHTISRYYISNKYNLGESIVHEGIAENFRESLVGRRKPWTEAVSEEKSKEIFREIKSLLKKEDLYEDLFFGKGKYPNWAGYTIGYYLVKDYLNKNFKDGKINWKEVFKIKPEEFLKNW